MLWMTVGQAFSPYVALWFRSFLFTQAVEIPIYVAFGWGRVPLWRAALAGAACSCLTHPLLWFVWPRVIAGNYRAFVVSGELGVAVIESLVFFVLAMPVRFFRAVSASFIANAASFGVGMLARKAGIL